MDALAVSLLDRLTPRQRECLELAADHWTSKEIGRRLNIAPKTVDRHIEEAVKKLGVADRAAAVRLLLGEPARTALSPAGDPGYGVNPHGERAPMVGAVVARQPSLRGSEGSHGQAAVDVHLDGRAGRLGDPGRNLAAEESGVLVAGTAEAEFGHFVSGRASGGDHQYGNPPWGIARGGGWAPEPVRRLVWVAAITAGLALTAGALIGSYDLMSNLSRIGVDMAHHSTAGSP
jgi:DNA-binding CsgD family transcriptional regulator